MYGIRTIFFIKTYRTFIAYDYITTKPMSVYKYHLCKSVSLSYPRIYINNDCDVYQLSV